MKLKGGERKKIREALVEAFPSSAEQFRLVVSDAGLEKSFTDFPGEYENRVQTVIEYAGGQGRLTNLLRSALEHAPANKALEGIAEFLVEYDGRIVAASAATDYGRPIDAFEAILFKNSGFEDVRTWLSDLDRRSRAICRIEPQPLARGRNGYGTGFLVGPNVVLTNDHVASGLDGKSGFWNDAERARDVVIRFDCENDAHGVATAGREYRLAEEYRILNSTAGDLDFALIRLEGEPSEDTVGGAKRDYVSLKDHQFQVREPLIILQHPRAEPIKLALGAVASSDKWSRNRIAYEVNTDGGSSGSPCLTQGLDVVALHHAGPSGFNEGIPTTALRSHWCEPENARVLLAAGLQHLLEDQPATPRPRRQAVVGPVGVGNANSESSPISPGESLKRSFRWGRYILASVCLFLLIVVAIGVANSGAAGLFVRQGVGTSQSLQVLIGKLENGEALDSGFLIRYEGLVGSVSCVGSNYIILEDVRGVDDEEWTYLIFIATPDEITSLPEWKNCRCEEGGVSPVSGAAGRSAVQFEGKFFGELPGHILQFNDGAIVRLPSDPD